MAQTVPAAASGRAGRRERHKQLTRRALVDAALRLAVEHGLERVTVEMISDAAGVSPRTFFNYFASKDDALVCVDDFAELLDALEQRPVEEDPFRALREVMRAHAATVVQDPEQWRMRFELLRTRPELMARLAMAFEPVERAIVDALTARCRSASASPVYPELLAACALAAGRVALQRWVELGGARPITELVDEVFDLLERGLEPPADIRSPRN